MERTLAACRARDDVGPLKPLKCEGEEQEERANPQARLEKGCERMSARDARASVVL